MLVAIQEDQAGVLVFIDYILSTTLEGFKVPLEPETYYRYPRIESFYRTCDTSAD